MLTTVVSSLTAQNVVVNGPYGMLQVTVSCPEEGKASYPLVYNGKQMLESYPLWLETNLGSFVKRMMLFRHQEKQIDTVYTQSRIKFSRIHYRAIELVCYFSND